MSAFAAGLLLQSVLATWPQCTERQQTMAGRQTTDAAELARRFAPILSFAPGERFFPTIPFFTGLDGDGSMGDSTKADLEDPWEIAPYLRDSLGHAVGDSSHVALKELLHAYHPDRIEADSGSRERSGGEKITGHQAVDYALDRVVVLYRICSLSPRQNRTVIRFLKSDEQAFERFEEARSLTTMLGKEPAFDVIQYFLYYLRDWGLQGHANDIELVSVFLPSNADRRRMLDRFRIVVGSGHSPRTPNNVLVLSAFHRGETRLDDSTFVMAELGGHSSAPDLRPLGRFTPGLDANWHAYNVWGTRDAQAASGVGYLGRYAQWMTFDRGWQTDGILVFPPSYESETPEGAACRIRDFIDQTQGQPIQIDKITDKIQGQPIRTEQPCADSSKQAAAERDSADVHQYRLLPMSLLSRLDTLLAIDTTLIADGPITLDAALDSTRLPGIVQAVTSIQDALCPPNLKRTGCRGTDSLTWHSKRLKDFESPAAQVEAIRAMLRWKNDLLLDTTYNRFELRDQPLPGLPRVVEELAPTDLDTRPATTHRPWEHESFMGKCGKGKECEGKADPTEVFKAHLFRPNTYTVGLDGGLRNLVIWGFTAVSSDGYEAYTGFVVPSFRSHGFPVRLGGFLELHAGIACGWRCRAMSPSFAVLHEGHRNSMISWYVTGTWVPRRPQVTATPGAGEFSLGGGVSLLPKIWSNTFRIVNVVRARIGVRFDPWRDKDVFSRARWELQLAFRQ